MKKRERHAVSEISTFLIIFACLLWWIQPALARQHSGGMADSSQVGGGRKYNAIELVPSTRLIRIGEILPETEVSQEASGGPYVKYGEFYVTVESGLRAWGAVIEPSSIRGPRGSTPQGNLMVRTELTDGSFEPLNGPVPIAIGDYTVPSKTVKVELAFAPTWRDPAGTYQGKLLLRGYIPEEEGMRLISPDQTRGIWGGKQTIRFVFKNDETIMIQQAEDEITFSVDGLPGERHGEAETTFWIWTNAQRWHVACLASPLLLMGGGHEIPASRIDWEQLDEYGRVVASGNLGEDSIILNGWEPANEARATVRLGVHLTMADLGGTYSGSIALNGFVSGHGQGH